MVFEEAISFDNLYSGLLSSQKGVIWKASVSGYSLNGLKNTYKLRQEILNGTYRISQYGEFLITEPKVREVLATRIKDRQFQHSLSDNILYPALTRTFIRDNCACQKGKGVFDALERVLKQLRSYAVNHKNEGYVLQCDIHKFFPSTVHDVTCDNLNNYDLDAKTRYHVVCVIKSFIEPKIANVLHEHGVDRSLSYKYAHELTLEHVYGDDKTHIHALLNFEQQRALRNLFKTDICGIGLGSQISQLTELALLNSLDYYIKEQLHIKVYERYMDDFILVHSDKEYLKYCLKKIEEFLYVKHLTLNPKTHIFKLKQGLTFLKWRYLITGTGKVIMRKRRENITKQRAKMRKLKKLLDEGRRSIEDIRENFRCWQAGIHYFGCFNLVMKMRRYYYGLFKEVAPRWKN